MLATLIAFMIRCVNSENIFFLQSAHLLNADIKHLLTLPVSPSNSLQNDVINADLSEVYHLYIASDAERKINISSACSDSVVVWFQREWSTLPLEQKGTVFDQCIIEIELLMRTSVISAFYSSDEFEMLAQQMTPITQRKFRNRYSLPTQKSLPPPQSRSKHPIASMSRARTRLIFDDLDSDTPDPMAPTDMTELDQLIDSDDDDDGHDGYDDDDDLDGSLLLPDLFVDMPSPLMSGSEPSITISVISMESPNLISQMNVSTSIQKYVLQDPPSKSRCHGVHFEKLWNDGSDTVTVMDPHGLSQGVHQWSLRLLRCACDLELQQVGVVAASDATMPPDLRGARAVFGYDLLGDSQFYGSFDADGQERCFRRLSAHFRWSVGDEIRVQLDLNRLEIKFYLNDKLVRRAMSLQPNTYYPMLCCSGDCRYKLN